jgi:hypothetical protein
MYNILISGSDATLTGREIILQIKKVADRFSLPQ